MKTPAPEAMPSGSIATKDNAPGPPVWASGLVRADGTYFSFLESSIPRAASMAGAELERAVAAAYRSLGRQLKRHNRHAVRIWNFVPRILDSGGDGLDRYMRFNSGRYQAFVEWFGEAEQFARAAPAASAVGHRGPDLSIHVLACRQPGVAIANPRQCPPHRYSARYGPMPPCFARARLVPAPSAATFLMIGGTASVRGEESVHTGNLTRQLDETFKNLAALLTAAFGDASDNPIQYVRELRIYHPRHADRSEIEQTFAAAFGGCSQREFMRAELCRADLLVEVEGLAVAPADRLGSEGRVVKRFSTCRCGKPGL